MHWMVPPHRLDEYQRSVIVECGRLEGQPQWIKGFAGSGKTVLVVETVHRILASNPNASVCIVVYTHALKDLIGSGIKSGLQVPVITYHQFLKASRAYDVVLVDEVQDIPIEKLKAINAKAGRLILAGDSEQSIYDNGCSPVEINSAMSPQSHELTISYRLTQKIVDLAKCILPKSNLANIVSTGRMEEVQVTLVKGASQDEELAWVWDRARRFSDPQDPSAILLPSHNDIQKLLRTVMKGESRQTVDIPNNQYGKPDYGAVNNQLRSADVPLRYLGNSYGSLDESDGESLTYVMTYHSAKGLDFETVFLPLLGREACIWGRDPDLEKRLFFVAMTRSRKNLFISYSGAEAHVLVRQLPSELLHTGNCVIEEEHEEEEDIFIF
ncbi:3'-5' exonuclease [Pseudomonadota bacterium]